MVDFEQVSVSWAVSSEFLHQRIRWNCGILYSLSEYKNISVKEKLLRITIFTVIIINIANVAIAVFTFACRFLTLILIYFWNAINCGQYLFKFNNKHTSTAWKVSVFGVILVRIFPHSVWIRRDTEYLSGFNPNAGKYGAE